MALPAEIYQRKQWMVVDSIRVLGLKNNGDLEQKKTDERPENDETIDIIIDEGMLWYRIFDSNTAVIETGLYPLWMIVSVSSFA